MHAVLPVARGWGFIHRDIELENVLFQDDGEDCRMGPIKLADWPVPQGLREGGGARGVLPGGEPPLYVAGAPLGI